MEPAAYELIRQNDSIFREKSEESADLSSVLLSIPAAHICAKQMGKLKPASN